MKLKAFFVAAVATQVALLAFLVLSHAQQIAALAVASNLLITAASATVNWPRHGQRE